MGQAATSGTSEQNGDIPDSSESEPRERDLQFLLGRLEELPDSARRLFSLGKEFLMTGSRSTPGESNDNFTSLFQIYQSPHTDDANTLVETENQLSNPQKTSVGLFNTPLRKSAPLYHFQTYIQWKASQDLHNFYSLCLPKRQTIYIQPIGEFPHFLNSFRFSSNNLTLSLFETIQAFLQVYFSGLEVMLRPPVSLNDDDESVKTRVHPVTGSQQLCVNDLYPYLSRLLLPNGLCIMGVSWTDLYPQGHNFALGEASPQYKSAVISFGRFEPKEFDPETHVDVSSVDSALIWKLLKSSSHELCHVLGLQHCTFFSCAMNESRSVSEAMAQPLFLCPVCLRKLQQACGFDVLERYTLLQRFLTSIQHQFPDCVRVEQSIAWLGRCIDFLNS